MESPGTLAASDRLNHTRLRRRLRPARRSFQGGLRIERRGAPGSSMGAGVLSPRRKQQEGTMQVSEILKVKGNALFTIAPEGRLSEAVSVMAQHNMGSLVVMDKGRMGRMRTFRESLQAIDESGAGIGEARIGDGMEA